MCRILASLLFIFFTASYSFAQTYVASTATSIFAPNSEVISRVSFGTFPFGLDDLNNPSLNGLLETPCTGYSDFTLNNNSNLDGNISNTVHAYGVAKTQTYQLEVHGGFCSASFSNPGLANRALKVFVDFNDDGDFTDPQEQVYVSSDAPGNFVQVDEPVFNTDITIPLTAVVGELRMRIVYRRVGDVFFDTFFWDLPNSGSEGSYPRGETEDYTLVVTGYIEDINSTSESCDGSDNGQIQIIPNVAAPVGVEFSINGLVGPWTNNLNYTNLPAGVYDVWARDAALNPAYVYEQYQIIVGSPTPVQLAAVVSSNYDGEDISCANASDGELTITPSGGDPTSYSFQYTAQSTNVTQLSLANVITGLSADTYDLVVIDNLGCESQPLSIDLQDPAPIVIDNILLNSDYNGFGVSCLNSCDAQITIFASGGSAPYQYNVNGNNFGLNNIAQSICAGNTVVTVTDVNNCDVTDNLLINSPNLLEITNVATTLDYNGHDISCFGNADAQVLINTNGGVGPYNYSIDAGLFFPHATNTISNLSADNYLFAVEDQNGCVSANFGHQIFEPTPVLINGINNQDLITCNGFSDGSVAIQVSGGTPNYQFSDDSGITFQANPLFTNLSEGNYTFLVQDLNGCSETSNFYLSEPTAVQTNVSVLSDFNGFDISCFGSNDGIINVVSQGGTGAYSYQVDGNGPFIPVPFSNQLVGFSAGNYSILVSDQNNCLSGAQAVNINEPNLLEIVNTQETLPVSCFGFADGIITVEAQGGVGAYTYLVGTQHVSLDQNPFTVSNLTAGLYNVVVSDQNNCSSALVVQEISQPNILQANVSTTNLGCNGGDEGDASVSVSGGTFPYSVLWSNNQTSNSIENLLAGQYSVQVNDANNCQVNLNFEITEPVLEGSASNLICYGDNIGQINVSLLNANPASVYTYLWDDPDGQTTISAINLSSGVYTLTATDQFNCILEFTDTITNPDSMIVFVDHSAICQESPIAKATVFSSGGELPYSYLWSTGEQSEQIDITVSDSYSVLVTDANNCESEYDFNIDPLSIMSVDFVTTNPSCKDNIDGQIAANVIGGYAPFSFEWSNNSTEQNLVGAGEGTYFLDIIDNNGCMLSTSAVLQSNSSNCLKVYSAFSPNGDQNNDYWHIDNIELYPDAIVEVFNRWGDRVFSTKKYLNSWQVAWDGTFNDNLLPSATYYYVITLNNDEEPYVGSVTLVR